MEIEGGVEAWVEGVSERARMRCRRSARSAAATTKWKSDLGTARALRDLCRIPPYGVTPVTDDPVRAALHERVRSAVTLIGAEGN
ncbi:hypothetical protein GCM10009673_19340 [Nesterenkonia sandarakina]